MPVAIRTAELSDYEVVRVINEHAVPAVSSISMTELRALAKQCCRFIVAIVDEEFAGFLMALQPGQDYRSENYRWFSSQYEKFVYVDRIAVSPAYKGRGIGRALYAAVETFAIEVAPILTCEVNILPPNPESMAFHTRLGFREVGQQDTEGGTKRVSLMMKQLVRTE
jgi:predicted GNAT superfamily acetyltransferase